MQKKYFICMLILFSLNITSCSELPYKSVSKTVDIEQKIVQSTERPDEFVFCDPTGGAWICNDPTSKTLIDDIVITNQSEFSDKSSDNKTLDDLIKQGLIGLSHAKVHKKNIDYSSEKSSKELYSEPVLIIWFPFDHYQLTPKSKFALLQLITEIDFVDSTVDIRGYTDEIGSKEYNDWLASQRANTVKEFFQTIEIPAKVINVWSKGLCCYLEPNDSRKHREKNRRVEIFIDVPGTLNKNDS